MEYFRLITSQQEACALFKNYNFTNVFPPAALDCDADWIVDPASGHCYKGFNSPVTLWSDARSRCQQHGADLASITSNREKEFIAGKYETESARSQLLKQNLHIRCRENVYSKTKKPSHVLINLSTNLIKVLIA